MNNNNNKEIDLTSLINKSNSYCLNENKLYPFDNLFSDNYNSILKSDADEQLLLSLKFNQTVKISSIQFDCIINSKEISMPKIIKLYCNRP